MEYYGLDYADPGHYDLVIDTSDLNVDQVVDRILTGAGARGVAPGP
jgi:cytidylate kinase